MTPHPDADTLLLLTGLIGAGIGTSLSPLAARARGRVAGAAVRIPDA